MDYLYLQYFYVIQTIQSSEFLVNSEIYKIAENSEKKKRSWNVRKKHFDRQSVIKILKYNVI